MLGLLLTSVSPFKKQEQNLTDSVAVSGSELVPLLHQHQGAEKELPGKAICHWKETLNRAQ